MADKPSSYSSLTRMNADDLHNSFFVGKILCVRHNYIKAEIVLGDSAGCKAFIPAEVFKEQVFQPGEIVFIIATMYTMEAQHFFVASAIIKRDPKNFEPLLSRSMYDLPNEPSEGAGSSNDCSASEDDTEYLALMAEMEKQKVTATDRTSGHSP